MTVRHIGMLVVFVLALASVATVAGCGSILPAAKLFELGFLPTQPVVTGPNVLGTMWAKCAPDRPDTHHVVLSLEWKTRGADWSVSASEVSDKIPGKERTSYQVKAARVAGIWRIKVVVAATFQGRHYDVTETSQERLVGADACKPG